MNMQLCIQCNQPISQIRITRRAKYCSKTCQKDYERLKYRLAVLSNDSTKIQRGAVAELLVSADLLLKGYDVYRALNPDSKADLVAVKHLNCILVQVRLVQQNINGGTYRCNMEGLDRCHILARVLPDRQIIYIPESIICQS